MCTRSILSREETRQRVCSGSHLFSKRTSALSTHSKWCSLPRMESLCPPAQAATDPSLQTCGELRLPGPALQALSIYIKNRVPIPSWVARENQALLRWRSCPLSREDINIKEGGRASREAQGSPHLKPKPVPQVSKTRTSDPLPRLRGSALTQFPGSPLPLPCMAFEHAFPRQLGKGSWGGAPLLQAPGCVQCQA